MAWPALLIHFAVHEATDIDAWQHKAENSGTWYQPNCLLESNSAERIMTDLVAQDYFLAVGQTHVGQRSHNEDAFYIGADNGVIIVADGVGGHPAGDVASSIACRVIARYVALGFSLTDAIRGSHQEVMQAASERPGSRGMATTVVAAHFDGPDFCIAWVGDSRAYLWDGQLKLLTQDHSYVQSLLSSGQITVQQAREHPRRNVIVQAVGLQGDDELHVEDNQGTLSAGQVLLLCSDGLSDVVDSGLISDTLAAQGPLQATCDALVAAALEAGGKDNISVVLVAGLTATDAADMQHPTVFWTFDPYSANI